MKRFDPTSPHKFEPNTLFYSDGYKPGHKRMLAPGTSRLYGTWIPRSLKYAPKGVKKVVSFGQQLVVRWLHDEFKANFFTLQYNEAISFAKDMCLYLGMEYDAEHFGALHKLGYLPFRVKSLPEGIETQPGIPHMTFVNTVDGFGWLTLYLETIISSLSWKPSTSATIALQYRRNVTHWVTKTDPKNAWLIPYLCHDFSARGLNPHDMLSSGLGHASSFRGSDTLICIPGSRYYYDEPEEEVCINSVNASEHSVTCTGIFYYQSLLKKPQGKVWIKEYYSFDAPCEGSVENPDYLAIAEWLNLRDWLGRFPKGILSVVSDTFDLWKLITFILPRLKAEILARDGKLVIRPDSGDPVDIICGHNNGFSNYNDYVKYCTDNLEDERPIKSEAEFKGVIELLWDIFGGTTSETGYKVLDPHVGAIYGDSINLERQIAIYERLAAKGFAATNIVLGVGSFTYQFNTRDTEGWAAKGVWFEIEEKAEPAGENVWVNKIGFNIFKDPITDDGMKKSLKGRVGVFLNGDDSLRVEQELDEFGETRGILQTIYEDGNFFNQTTLTEIRKRIDKLVEQFVLETV